MRAILGGHSVSTDCMPGRIRTPDLLIRSQTLYPAELRARYSRPCYPIHSKLFQDRGQT